MSDLRLQSRYNEPMSIDPSLADDPNQSVCRATPSALEGARGTSGRSEASGGAPSASADVGRKAGTECLDEILAVAGSCGALALSAGAAALVAGFGCAGATLNSIDCLQREVEARKP